MIKMKHILQEDEVEDNFGKVVFGSDMDIVRMQGRNQGEKNTPYETELLQALQLWVTDSDEETAKLLYRKFPLLKKAAKVFPKILKPKTPNGTQIFRGLQDISFDLWMKLSETNPSEWTEEHGLWKYGKPISYKPHKLVQSWSSDALTALSFMDDDGALLSTKQNDEFLFNQEFIKMLFSQTEQSFGDESEILHFGKIYADDVYIEIQSQIFKKMFTDGVNDDDYYDGEYYDDY